MIYKISAINMPAAFNKGGELVVMNTDGVHGLMQNLTDTDNVSVAESYEDNQLASLLALPEWQKG